MRADFDACANSISFCLNLFLAQLSESVRNKIVPNKSDRDLLCISLRWSRGICHKTKNKKSVVGLHLVLYGTWFVYVVLYITWFIYVVLYITWFIHGTWSRGMCHRIAGGYFSSTSSVIIGMIWTAIAARRVRPGWARVSGNSIKPSSCTMLPPLEAPSASSGSSGRCAAWQK